VSRGTTAIIDFKNLRHNFNVLKELAPNKLVLVVKADAYGHGLKQVVEALDNVDCFAVATIDEALIIRQTRPHVRVLLLEGFLSQYELDIAFENNFDSVIHQQQQLDLIVESDINQKINIWLKYDSGMNRLGFSENEFIDALSIINQQKNINEIILMSHFASANNRQSQFTQEQTKRFLSLSKGYPLSLSNSSAMLNGKCLKDEWCRVGLALFGVSPVEDSTANEYNLKPVMTMKSNIIAIKTVNAGESIGYSQTYTTDVEMKIAIVGLGYGDGYPWSLSKSAYVKINNHKATIVGRVSMDMLAIDISDLNNVNIGDSVLIWGKESNSELLIENVANNAFTIPYVLLCQITSRVKYQYVNK